MPAASEKTAFPASQYGNIAELFTVIKGALHGAAEPFCRFRHTENRVWNFVKNEVTDTCG